MTDQHPNALCFTPRTSRRVMTSMAMLILVSFSALFAVFCGYMTADFFVPRVMSEDPWVILFSAGWIWWSSFCTSYLMNATTRSVNIDETAILIKTNNGVQQIKITDLTGIVYRNTVRGWMYIIFETVSDALVVSNFSFFDNEFIGMRGQISNFMDRIGKGGLIRTDSVTSVGLFRNKKMPPFIYRGFWKYILFYTALTGLVVAACLVLNIRPNALIMYHKRWRF